MHKKNNLTQYVLTWKTLQDILLTEKNKVHMLHSWFLKQIYLCNHIYLYVFIYTLSVYMCIDICVYLLAHIYMVIEYPWNMHEKLIRV